MMANSPDNLNNLLEQLRLSWFNLLDKSSAEKKLGDKIFTSLTNSYSEPARSYHNLKHIYDLLHYIDQIENIAENVNVLQFSAWFHDYIYDPQSLNNEARSAVYAIKSLRQLNIDRQTIDIVEQIILSTKNHQPLIKNIDNLLFLDVDLAILGTTPNKYQKYTRAIRQEYSHLSNRDYLIGRRKVLTQFLNRKRIYYTDYFYQNLELAARKNLQAEVNCFDPINLI